MQQIKIEKAQISDLKPLLNVAIQTFIATFSEHNSKENMQNYVEENFSEQKLKTELANPNSQFFVAKFSDEIIGYLKINTANAQTEIKENNALEIERIYVLQEFLGKKVGQKLFEKAIEIAKELKVDFVWLGVWEKNERAIAFYKKNGFVVFDSHVFVLGNESQKDIMMKLNLA